MSETVISRRRVLQGAGIAGAASLVALTPTVARADTEGSLVGTWRGTGSATGIPTFGVLIAFNAGGTLVSSASIDFESDFLSTPSYGAWKRTGDGRYAIKFEFFTAGAGGTPTGSGAVRGTFTVDDDRLHGPVTVTILDLSGKKVFSTPGSISAHRIEVD